MPARAAASTGCLARRACMIAAATAAGWAGDMDFSSLDGTKGWASDHPTGVGSPHQMGLVCPLTSLIMYTDVPTTSTAATVLLRKLLPYSSGIAYSERGFYVDEIQDPDPGRLLWV